MTPNVRPRLRLLLAGTAALGVIFAHLAAFLIAEPNSHVREELLASTGHQYWAATITLGLALFVGGLLSLVWSSVRASGPRSAAAVFVEAAPRLALLQVIGFVLLEAVERLSVGHSVAGLATEPVVVIGVLTQIVVAIVGAALAALLTRVVHALAAAVKRAHVRAPRTLLPRFTVDFTPSLAHMAVGGSTLRGPPAP